VLFLQEKRCDHRICTFPSGGLDGSGLYDDSLLSMCNSPKARRARNRRGNLCFLFQRIVFWTSDRASHNDNQPLFSLRRVLLRKVVLVNQAVTMVQSFFRHQRAVWIVWIVRIFGPRRCDVVQSSNIIAHDGGSGRSANCIDGRVAIHSETQRKNIFLFREYDQKGTITITTTKGQFRPPQPSQ
jgi:hypothetical protein